MGVSLIANQTLFILAFLLRADLTPRAISFHGRFLSCSHLAIYAARIGSNQGVARRANRSCFAASWLLWRFHNDENFSEPLPRPDFCVPVACVLGWRTPARICGLTG